MSSLKVQFIRALAALSLLSIGACIQMPTEQQRAVELRSGLSFGLQDPQTNVTGWRVVLDGLDMGSLLDLTSGNKALQVLPGNHVLRIASPQGVVLEERIFVAEGAVKHVLVPRR